MVVMLLFLLLFFLVGSKDQRLEVNWPFKRTRNYTSPPTGIRLLGRNDYLLTFTARSSFRVNITFIMDSGMVPEYTLTHVLIRDHDWVSFYHDQGTCMNDKHVDGPLKGLNREKWCCNEVVVEGQEYNCFFKKLNDYNWWVFANTSGVSQVWEFNRVSYEGELIDFDIARGEFNKLRTLDFQNDKNNDDMKTNFVLNLRSADHINRAIVLRNPSSSEYRIDKIIIEENADLERDVKGSEFTRIIFSQELTVVYLCVLIALAAIVAIIYVLISILSCVVTKKGREKLSDIKELFGDDKKVFFRQFLVTVFFHLKDSMDEVQVVAEILGLGAEKKDNLLTKVEEIAENTGYCKQVEEDRENRMKCRTPGAIIAIIFAFLVGYFLDNGIDALGTHLVSLNNKCAIAEMCCPEGGSVENKEELIINPTVDGDPFVRFAPGQACYWEKPTVSIGELEMNMLESRYEKCYYSQYSWPVCQIVASMATATELNDTRPICNPDDYYHKLIPMWVEKSDSACKPFDLTSSKAANSIFMKIVIALLALIIAKPIMLPVSAFFKMLSMGIAYLVCLPEKLKKKGDSFKEHISSLKEKFKKNPVKNTWGIIKVVLITICFFVSMAGLIVFIYFVVFAWYHQTEGGRAWLIILDIVGVLLLGVLTNVLTALLTYILKFKWKSIVKDEEEEKSTWEKIKGFFSKCFSKDSKKVQDSNVELVEEEKTPDPEADPVQPKLGE